MPRWTAPEVEQLQTVLREACASHQISQDALFNSRCRQNIWYEIAQKFLHRQVESVYKKARREYENGSRQNGPWTNEECKRLSEFVALHGTKWVTIGKLLNRTADACADKYRENNAEYTKGRFTDYEDQKLMQLVTDYEKDSKNNEQELPWTAISKRMGDRSRLSCYRRWQKLIRNKNDGGEESSSPPAPLPVKSSVVSAPNKRKRDAEVATKKDNNAPVPLPVKSPVVTASNKRKRGTKVSTKMHKSALAPFSVKSSEVFTKKDSSAAGVDTLEELAQLYSSLDRLYLQSDLHTVTRKDIFKALETEFDVTSFPKKTRKLLKNRLKKLLSGEIVPENDVTKQQQRNTGRGDSTEEQADTTSEKTDQYISAAAKTISRRDDSSATLTIKDVSKAMKRILKSVPTHCMKKKKLRRAIKAKCNLKKSRQVKKFMKILLADDSKQRRFKLDGKVVSIIRKEI